MLSQTESVGCCLICDAHGVITCLCNIPEISGNDLHHEFWCDCDWIEMRRDFSGIRKANVISTYNSELMRNTA